MLWGHRVTVTQLEAVPTNPAGNEIRTALIALSEYRSLYLSGDEKGEAQVFLERLFQAFGHDGINQAGATLEARLRKSGGSKRTTSFADLLWKKRCLIEMKKAGTDLKRHYRQAFDYWIAAVPDRPRYVVLCNFDEFWIYDFDAQLDEPVDRVSLEDLSDRWEALTFLLPTATPPVFQNDLVAVTRDAASDVSKVFRAMVARGVERGVAQRFVLQCVMAMFAEDVHLLPTHMFVTAVDDCLKDPDPSGRAYDLLFGLFREMNEAGVTGGGRFKGVPYFNGGLFANIQPIEITTAELKMLQHAASTNWAFVRPEIFGTIFEQSMDKDERHAAGAHYTSQADIAQVVLPTIVNPWRARIETALEHGSGGISALEQLLPEMMNFKVLDPACGSGNFLYVAYREMRRLEAEVHALIADKRRNSNTAAQASFNYVTTDHFYGIDINGFAVEMAKITMMLAKKLAADELNDTATVLPLDNLDASIVQADALFSPWPDADAVIGNPPFLGRRNMVEELGVSYTHRLARAYPEVGGVSDFVAYWFPLAHNHISVGARAGLIATNSIRQNETRRVSLDYIEDHGGVITEAVSSKPWSGEANVFVSIINWIKTDATHPAPEERVLWVNDAEGRLIVPKIPTSLSPNVDVRSAKPLPFNQTPSRCFQGQTPGVTRVEKGFVLDRAQMEAITSQRDGSDAVIHPFLGGREMLNKLEVDRWVIDIPDTDLRTARSRYPAAFRHLSEMVLGVRQKKADEQAAKNAAALQMDPKVKVNNHHAGFLESWWQLGYRRADLLRALGQVDRYIATSRVTTVNRLAVFEFVDARIHPSDAMTVFVLDDDYSLGVLSSAVHGKWIEARCSTMKGDPRYTSTTVWDSFPFPQAPSPKHVAKVAGAMADILELREQLASEGDTLAAQYDDLRLPGRNQLRELHRTLDSVVYEAYGFSPFDEVLTQLLALNLELAEQPTLGLPPGAASAVISSHKLLPPQSGQ
jgi:hypothetical protein